MKIFKKMNFKFVNNKITKIVLFCIFVITILAGTITLGVKTSFNFGSYNNLSSDYGNSLSIDMKVSEKTEHTPGHLSTDKIIDELYGQTKELGLKNIKVNRYGDSGINVNIPGTYNQFEKRRLVDYITSKPYLTFRDEKNKSLFSNGEYDSNKPTDNTDVNQKLPINAQDVKKVSNNANQYSISIGLASVTSESYDQLKALVAGVAKSHLVIWLGYQGLYDSLRNDAVFNSSAYNGDLYKYVQSTTPGGQSFGVPQSIYNKNELADYNGASLKIENIAPVNLKNGANQDRLVISNANWKSSKLVDSIISRIKYSSNRFTFKTVSVSTLGPKYSKSRITAIITILSIVTFILFLWLIWNYGILGFIGVLSLFTAICVNFAVFKFIGGEITTGILISIALSTLLIISTIVWQLTVFKKEVKSGSKGNYALNRSRRNSLSGILDIKATLLLTTFTFFYFSIGVLENVAISPLFFMIVASITTVFINRLLINLLVNSEVLNNKMNLLCGIKTSKISLAIANKFEKICLTISNVFSIKSIRRVLKWSFIAFSAGGTLFIIIFSSIKGSFTSSLVLGDDFKTRYEFNVYLTNNGGSDLTLKGQTEINNKDISNIKSALKNSNINYDGGHLAVETIYFYDGNYNPQIDKSKTKHLYAYTVYSKTSVSVSSLDNAFKKANDNYEIRDFGNGNTIKKISNTLFSSYVKKLSIAVLLSFIPSMVYLMFRFKWTGALSILKTALLNLIIMFSFVVVFRIPVSFNFIEILLPIMLFNLTFSSYLFNSIKSKLKHTDRNENTKEDLEKAVSEVKKNIKPFFITITTISVISMLIIMATLPLAVLPIIAAVIFGIIMSSTLSYNLTSKIWLILENHRLTTNRKIKNSHLTVDNEQIFKNIND